MLLTKNGTFATSPGGPGALCQAIFTVLQPDLGHTRTSYKSRRPTQFHATKTMENDYED